MLGTHLNGHLLFLNGPPGCGKDTLGLQLYRILGDMGYKPYIEKMAKPLKVGGSAALGIPFEELEGEWKGTPIPGLGFTWREYQISMSEDWYKKQFGPDIFGRLLVSRISRLIDRDVIIVTDCGFNEEIPPVIAAYPRGRIAVIRIHRAGHTYDGDSREWIDDSPHYATLDLGNNARIEDLVLNARTFIMSCLT